MNDAMVAEVARRDAERKRKLLPLALRRDQELARKRMRAGGGRLEGSSGRLTSQISLGALMNAVDTEGREVLSAAGDGYWRDQARRYELGGDCHPAPGRRNRFGRVTWSRSYAAGAARQ